MQRYVGSQLTCSFERKQIMPQEIEATRGLVGRHVETYAYADTRTEMQIRHFRNRSANRNIVLEDARQR